MTMPVERSRSIRAVRRAALALIEHMPARGGKYARVPAEKLRELNAAFRHYPWDYYIVMSHKSRPDIWGPLD